MVWFFDQTFHSSDPELVPPMELSKALDGFSEAIFSKGLDGPYHLNTWVSHG